MAVILGSYIMPDGWELRLLPGINLQWHRGVLQMVSYSNCMVVLLFCG